VTDESHSRLSPTPNGPFHVQGDVRVVIDQGDTVFEGTETWLCRCGHSDNKPFCDGSHERVGFADPGALTKTPRPAEEPADGPLTIILRPNGPLRMSGPYALTAPDGSTCDVADKGSLCRCGLSQTKPMCDGSHKGSDFEA
jgi:CDGSH-type Zn-finger protein